jgi:hypothetical protein
MIRQFGFQGSFDQPLGKLLEQPVLAQNVLWIWAVLQQLVDEGVLL